MRRNKEWWSKFSLRDRAFIVQYERGRNIHYGHSDYLPDDCTECGVCEQPCMSSPCDYCSREYNRILAITHALAAKINGE